MAIIENLTAVLGIKVDKVQWKAANHTLKKFAKDFFNLKLGLVAAVTGLVAFESHLGKMMTHMGNMSQIMQLPVDRLQALQLAAKEAGVPFTALSGAIGGLQNDIVNFKAGMKMPDSLMQGLATLARQSQSSFIDPTKFKNGASLFRSIIADVAKIKTVAGKEGVLNQIFSNSAILPVVANGMGKIDNAYAQLKKRGLLFTPQQIAQAKAFHSNMALTTTSLGLTADVIGQKLMPVMDKLAVSFNNLSKNKEFINGLKDIIYLVGKIAQLFVWLISLMGKFSHGASHFHKKDLQKTMSGTASPMTIFHSLSNMLSPTHGLVQVSAIEKRDKEASSINSSQSTSNSVTNNNQQSHVTTHVHSLPRNSLVTSHITGGFR